MLFETELDEVLLEIVTRWSIPGLAVGIVEGDEMIYAKKIGVQSLETRSPVTFDSLFCIASVSKCFVATAVIQLAEQEKINLDTPLVHYLPYFRLDDDRCQLVTIRQMLSHTSGMPDMDESEYDELVAHPESDEGAAERFVRGLSNLKLLGNPGEQFSYSNIAYDVLGDMISKVAGQSFESYMQEHILNPYGMLQSTFLLADIPSGLLAVPHVRTPEMKVNPIYPYHRADAPASFLHTTILDMCHWCVTCLNRGSYRGHNILSPASFEMMWSPVIQRGRRPNLYEDMALGWNLGHYKDVKTIGHGGMGFGWSDFLLIMPEQNRAAAILCNEESFAINKTIQAVADTLIDQKPQASTISWMVPISEGLVQGGIQAAYTRYHEIKASKHTEYYFGEDDLNNLVIQLVSAGKLDLAIDVLGLNLHVFPAHVESYMDLAKIYIAKGEIIEAKKNLLKALSIDPGHAGVRRLLEKIR